MFEKKEYIYSETLGVCRVDDVTKLSLNRGLPMTYYVLRSVSNKDKVSYIPVEHHQVQLYPVTIRKTEETDIDEMMKIYAYARTFMAENGNPHQWADAGYPAREVIEEDIAKERSYVCVKEDQIVGTFMYFEGIEPTYLELEEGEWRNEEPYGVVHRIASAEGTKGVASFCLTWAYEKCRNLRIDTHHDNTPMQGLLNKLGFYRCGIVHMEDGTERIAFQKCK